MKNLLLITFLLLSKLIYCQNSGMEVFKRISAEVENFTVNTSAVPEDKLTQEIRKLRKAKGGFNIDDAVLYKIAEDRNKNDISGEEAEKLINFFTKGDGKIMLENAVIWIYRDHFTQPEIKKLKRFYSSSAGKKMSQNFPIIMIESLKSAEKIIENYKSKDKN